MIYLITGSNDRLIRLRLQDIIKKSEGEPLNFDCRKDGDFEDIHQAFYSINLFGTKNVIVVRNPYFLFESCGAKDDKLLNQCVDNPSKNNDLIFYSQEKAFDKRLKMYKLIKSNAQELIIENPGPYNYYDYVAALINERNIKFTSGVRDKLINYVKNDIELLMNILDKLSLIDEPINEEILLQLIEHNSEEQTFEFINSLLKHDYQKTFSYLDECLKVNNSVVSILYLLVSQIRYFYAVSFLSKQGKSKDFILKSLGGSSSQYRLNKALETLRYTNDKELINLLFQLSEFDYNLKNNTYYEERSEFENIILNFCRGNYAK